MSEIHDLLENYTTNHNISQAINRHITNNQYCSENSFLLQAIKNKQH